MTEDLITGAEHWRRVRRLLNEHRLELAAMAAGLYPDLPRVAGHRPAVLARMAASDPAGPG